jgi:hypothetical protein
MGDRLTLAEKETVVRWDAETEMVVAWTADSRVARQWQDLNWPVEVAGRDRHGKARSWEARGVPSKQVLFLRLPKKKAENSSFFETTAD